MYSVLDSMAQCITLFVSRGAVSWACSGVYASPVYTSRCQLWDHLKNVRGNILMSWAMIGDFNEIILQSEQRGATFLMQGLRSLLIL